MLERADLGRALGKLVDPVDPVDRGVADADDALHVARSLARWPAGAPSALRSRGRQAGRSVNRDAHRNATGRRLRQHQVARLAFFCSAGATAPARLRLLRRFARQLGLRRPGPRRTDWPACRRRCGRAPSSSARRCSTCSARSGGSSSWRANVSTVEADLRLGHAEAAQQLPRQVERGRNVSRRITFTPRSISWCTWLRLRARA